MMEKKGKNVEEELTQERIPIEVLPEKFLWMHVKGGTKVSNVVDFAEKAFKNGEHRSVVWSGSGGGVAKTISCAEIMKRNYDVQQVTRLTYQKIEEYWDPILAGLDPIIVTRQVPAIHIFLSLDSIDSKTLGYQKAKGSSPFWPDSSSKNQKRDDDYVYRNKRNSNGSNRNNSNNQKNKSKTVDGSNSRPDNNPNKSRNKKPNPKPQEEPGTSQDIAES